MYSEASLSPSWLCWPPTSPNLHSPAGGSVLVAAPIYGCAVAPPPSRRRLLELLDFGRGSRFICLRLCLCLLASRSQWALPGLHSKRQIAVGTTNGNLTIAGLHSKRQTLPDFKCKLQVVPGLKSQLQIAVGTPGPPQQQAPDPSRSSTDHLYGVRRQDISLAEVRLKYLTGFGKAPSEVNHRISGVSHLIEVVGRDLA